MTTLDQIRNIERQIDILEEQRTLLLKQRKKELHAAKKEITRMGTKEVWQRVFDVYEKTKCIKKCRKEYQKHRLSHVSYSTVQWTLEKHFNTKISLWGAA